MCVCMSRQRPFPTGSDNIEKSVCYPERSGQQALFCVMYGGETYTEISLHERGEDEIYGNRSGQIAKVSAGDPAQNLSYEVT